jgi:hypothetical protein
MTRDEAKLILGASDALDNGAADPDLRAALDLAATDGVLSKWLASERALDSVIAAKLREGIPCPPGLKNDLLAARRVVRPPVWWRRPAWMAAAAALMLLAAIAGVIGIVTKPVSLHEVLAVLVARSVSSNADSALNPPADLESTRVWLGQHGADTNFVAPKGLSEAAVTAREIFTWRGHVVSRIKFKLPGENWAILYIVEQPRFPNPHCCEDAPFNTRIGGFSTTHWLNEERLYILVAPGEVDFSRLFRSP